MKRKYDDTAAQVKVNTQQAADDAKGTADEAADEAKGWGSWFGKCSPHTIMCYALRLLQLDMLISDQRL